MQSELTKQFSEDPTMLNKLIKNFKRWDKNGDGFVTPEEFDEYLHELEDMAQKETDPDKSAKCERKMAKVQGIKKQIFEEADVDKDGKIDLWEIMAHTLGRKKMPVEILLY